MRIDVSEIDLRNPKEKLPQIGLMNPKRKLSQIGLRKRKRKLSKMGMRNPVCNYRSNESWHRSVENLNYSFDRARINCQTLDKLLSEEKGTTRDGEDENDTDDTDEDEMTREQV